MDFSMDDALRMIGLKEATIFGLQSRVAEAEQKLANFARHESVPTPCAKECCAANPNGDSVPKAVDTE